MDTDAIRQKLSEFVTFSEGIELREVLKVKAAKNYQPQHQAAEYLAFMNANACRFRKNGPQSKNHPWVWCLFTCKSQHVYGDCIEECLDRAMSS